MCVEKNSLIHVGPSGHIPTQLEAAMMAKKVYSAEKEKKDALSGRSNFVDLSDWTFKRWS